MPGHPTPGTTTINDGRFEPYGLRCYGREVRRLALVTFVVWLSACSSAASDRTPSGALALFLEAMGEAQDDPRARERAFELLAPESKRRLSERARLAAALSGRHFEPWEMLVEGRYRLRFAPRDGRGFEERVDGDRAIVVVHGQRSSARAEVPMVRDSGRWRVYLDVPEPGRATPPTSSGAAPRAAAP